VSCQLGHLVFSKIPQIILGWNESFPYALQVSLEKNARKVDRDSQTLEWRLLISGTWFWRLFANKPFGTTISMITGCENLIIFQSEE
jgi:hypothetical protein